jgi:tetratricopeptide (TPR) repeat protein
MVAPRASLATALLLAFSAPTFVSAQPQAPVAPQPAPAAQNGTPLPGQPVLSEAVIQEARRAYDEGSAHYVAGRYNEALVAFERAYSLRPNPVVLMPILECHDRLGHVPEAIRTLDTYLHAMPEIRNRALLETRLENLRRRPARVHVITTPPGARVIINGQAHRETTPTDVDLPPGHHQLVATLEGYTTETREFDTIPGTPRDEVVLLERELATALPQGPAIIPLRPRPSRAPGPVVWIAAGLAGASLVAGTTFGVLALSENNDYDQDPTRETRDRGLRYAVVSDVAFGLAAVSAVFGTVMYFVERGRAAPEPRSASAAVASTSSLRLSPTGLRVDF